MWEYVRCVLCVHNRVRTNTYMYICIYNTSQKFPPNDTSSSRTDAVEYPSCVYIHIHIHIHMHMGIPQSLNFIVYTQIRIHAHIDLQILTHVYICRFKTNREILVQNRVIFQDQCCWIAVGNHVDQWVVMTDCCTQLRALFLVFNIYISICMYVDMYFLFSVWKYWYLHRYAYVYICKYIAQTFCRLKSCRALSGLITVHNCAPFLLFSACRGDMYIYI